MNIRQFIRKSFPVDAVRVTSENLEDVASWCNGDIRVEDRGDKGEVKYIKVNVQRPMNDRQTKAFVGDWVLHAGKGFKIYPNAAFNVSFESVPDKAAPKPGPKISIGSDQA